MNKSIEVSGVEDLPVRIVEQLNSDYYDFIVLRIPPRGEHTQSERIPAEAQMIYDLIRITGCPVLSVSNFPICRKFSHILQPIGSGIDHIQCYRKMIPLIRLFNSTLHLLMVVDRMESDVYNHGVGILKSYGDLFRRYHVKVKSRIIRHPNRTDTILAYADIIGAGLIGNMMKPADGSGKEMEDAAWYSLVDRSEIPLYNFYG